MATKHINIAFIGMGKKSIATFDFFIRKHAEKLCRQVNIKQAEAFIVDYDSSNGQQQWQQTDPEKKIPVILISSQQPEESGWLWVPKPVKGSDLKHAIQDLVRIRDNKQPTHHHALARSQKTGGRAEKPSPQPQDVATDIGKIKTGYNRSFDEEACAGLNLSRDEIVECCGKLDDVDIHDHDQRQSIFHNDKKTLVAPIQAGLRLAKRENKDVEIDLLKTRIILLAGGERIQADLNNRVIRHICAIPLPRRLDTTLIEPPTIEQCHVHKAETVLWQVALWTARGRLPNTLEPEKAVRLMRWPNFTRLQITPHALRIAAAWTQKAMSPLQIAEALEIPQRYVFSVASAADALGLFTDKNSNQHNSYGSWKNSRNLFSSILRSLRNAA